VTIDLSTSNRDVARPATSTVTVPAGATTATFRIEVTTVGESQDVQITARYLNVAINAILRVTLFPPVARFNIAGKAKGDSRCTVNASDANMDCSLDASTSAGVLRYWRWTYSIGSDSNTDVRTDAFGAIELSGGCNLLQNHGTATDDNNEKYLNLDVSLVVEDREGTQSSKATKTIRVYPNGFCGY